MAAGCPAMTRQVTITARRPLYVVATSLPDCRGAGPVLTVGRGTPMPFGSPTLYDGPVRYGVAGPPLLPGGKLPAFHLTGEPAWRQKLRADLAASTSKRVLLFVHGFNNSPAEALSRADAIGIATGFEGPVIAFVWPSQRAVAKYTWDEENNHWTQPYLDSLLLALTSESDDVVLVAHSMGNRIAIEALRDLQRSHPGLSTSRSNDRAGLAGCRSRDVRPGPGRGDRLAGAAYHCLCLPARPRLADELGGAWQPARRGRQLRL